MKRIILIAGVLAWVLLSALGAQASPAPRPVSVCSASAPGQAHCDGSLLMAKNTHRLIRPDVRSPRATSAPGNVGPAGEAQPATGSPQWLQQAYDLTALSASKGAGDTIAIVDPDDDPAVASDLASFRETYGLPVCDTSNGCLRVVNEQGAASPLPASDPGWATEETIDTDAASSVCPNCSLLLVEASSTSAADLATAMQTAANLGADQISASWSITAGASPFAPNLLTPGHPGGALPAVFAASGDGGADPLGQAEFPAALPSVTAVGGTTLTSTNSSADPRGYSESAWLDGGSGCAIGEAPLSYQPTTGCAGRAYSDVSADADPNSGLNIYEASRGGWAISGGTSLATPIVAAFDAITGVNAQTPQWAYADAAALNDPVSGSDGTCSGGLSPLMCSAGSGYDGPTGAGSVSGAVVPGAPGVSAPILQLGGQPTDVAAVSANAAQLAGGVNPNQEATSYAWQYGTTTDYGAQSTPQAIPAGVSATEVSGHLSNLQPGTTYHLRLMASNAGGTSYGYDMTFVTAKSPAQHQGPKQARVRGRRANRRASSTTATDLGGVAWLGRRAAAADTTRP